MYFLVLKKQNQWEILIIGISCNVHSALSQIVDVAIELGVGAEIITGSTRLKAGTARKMVLNMLSTTAMIKTGKVYKNLMVNVQATNEKLRKRATSIIQELTGVEYGVALEANEEDKGDTRVAILTLLFNVNVDYAKRVIEKYQGNFIKALNELDVQINK